MRLNMSFNTVVGKREAPVVHSVVKSRLMIALKIHFPFCDGILFSLFGCKCISENKFYQYVSPKRWQRAVVVFLRILLSNWWFAMKRKLRWLGPNPPFLSAIKRHTRIFLRSSCWPCDLLLTRKMRSLENENLENEKSGKWEVWREKKLWLTDSVWLRLSRGSQSAKSEIWIHD